MILTKDFSAKADSGFLEKARKKHEITGITGWDFADIPESVIIKVNEETRPDIFSRGFKKMKDAST